MKKTKDKIGFSLINIRTDQFALFEENFDEKGRIAINTKLSYGLNKTERNFSVSTKFTFEIRQKPFLTIEISCFFNIIEETFKNFISEDKLIFPKGFVAHMVMLTYGTARGVLHAKTESTMFNKFILPTTNVAKMIPKDVVFE